MIENLKCGNKVVLSFETNHKKSYTSYIESIYENQLLIYSPIEDKKFVNLPMEDTLYMVKVFNEKGVFTFHNAVISKRFDKGDYHFILLDKLNYVAQEQRREFYRLDCMVPFLIKDKNEETYQAIIKDLSEGGLLFVSNLEMFVSEERECSVSFNNKRITMLIKLLDKHNHIKPGCRFEYRAKLVFVDENDKNVLLDFIFDSQRNYIRKNQTAIAQNKLDELDDKFTDKLDEELVNKLID